VIQSAHGVDSPEAAVGVLVAFAKEALGRFDFTADTCARVLGGGVTARFHGRLLPVKTFLEDTWGKKARVLAASRPITAAPQSAKDVSNAAAESPAGGEPRKLTKYVWVPEDEDGEPHDRNPHDRCGGGVYKMENVSDVAVSQSALTTLVLQACGVSKGEVSTAVHTLTSDARQFIEPSDSLG
jgi:hypothetical protein